MREYGYYWVRLPNCVWEVADFADGYWYMCGSINRFRDRNFEQIGEKIERKQTGLPELEYAGGNTNIVFPEKGHYSIKYDDGKIHFNRLSKARKFYDSLLFKKELWNEDYIELVFKHIVKK